MELDAMKARWAECDRKLDIAIRLDRQRARTPVRRFAYLSGGGAVFGVLCMLATGQFIYGHRTEPRFAVPGALLHVWLIAMVAAWVRMMTMAMRVDYEGPVTAIQKELEILRMLRIRVTQWALLTGQLVWWIPFLIVALEGIWGVDAYRIFRAGWLVSNVVFGLLVIPLAIWISRRFGGRMSGWLMRELGGYNLNAAKNALGEAEEFSAG